jgi:hypothetical protein
VNSYVNFTDEIFIEDLVLNNNGQLNLNFAAATSSLNEYVKIFFAQVKVDLPDIYIYEIDLSAMLTQPGAFLSMQLSGTNSGSLTSLSAGALVTEMAAGSGMWDITFFPQDATSNSSTLEMRILEGTEFQLESMPILYRHFVT